MTIVEPPTKIPFPNGTSSPPHSVAQTLFVISHNNVSATRRIPCGISEDPAKPHPSSSSNSQPTTPSFLPNNPPPHPHIHNGSLRFRFRRCRPAQLPPGSQECHHPPAPARGRHGQRPEPDRKSQRTLLRRLRPLPRLLHVLQGRNLSLPVHGEVHLLLERREPHVHRPHREGVQEGRRPGYRCYELACDGAGRCQRQQPVNLSIYLSTIVHAINQHALIYRIVEI